MGKRVSPAEAEAIGKALHTKEMTLAEAHENTGWSTSALRRMSYAYRDRAQAADAAGGAPSPSPKVNITISADLTRLQAENIDLASRLRAAEEETATLQKVVMALGRSL